MWSLKIILMIIFSFQLIKGKIEKNTIEMMIYDHETRYMLLQRQTALRQGLKMEFRTRDVARSLKVGSTVCEN